MHCARRLVFASIVGAAVCAITSCIDLTPVDLDSGVLGNGGSSDSDGSSPSDGAARSPCEQCLFGVGDERSACQEQLDACSSTAKCLPIIECMFGKDCFALHESEEINRCSLPCVLAAGVTSPSDPGVVVAIALSNCAAELCSDVCFTGQVDASTAL